MSTLQSKLNQAEEKALTDLLDFVGSKSLLAELAEVSPQVVHGWVHRGRISKKAAHTIERTVGSGFTYDRLRPSIGAVL